MRLTFGLVLLLGCTPEVTVNSPPVVSEPAAGFKSDRSLIRVHMSAPGDGNTSTTTGMLKGHANWRVNGGSTTEVDKPITDRDPVQPFVFSAIVPAGSNSLELGRCDDLDKCGYTSVNVTVTPVSGSPDPSFAGAGQLIDSKFGRAEGVAVFPDGRVLVAAEANAAPFKMGLIMFKPDGTKDRTWGVNGVTSLTAADLHAFMLPRPSGGVLVIFARRDRTYVARFDAMGTLDTAFADSAQGGEVRGFPWGAPGAGSILDARVDDAGHVLVAGQIARVPFVQSLDFDLQSLSYGELGPAGTNVVAASLDKNGRAAFLLEDGITRGTTAGVDVAFGHVDLPADTSGVGAVALRADGSVVSVRKNASALHVAWASPTGALSEFEVPSDGPAPSIGDWPLMLQDSATGVYLATSGEQPADPVRAWKSGSEPGSDFVVHRLNAGALDASFGRAWASFALSWAPVSTDALLDTPGAMAIDAAGKPIVVGGSSTVASASADLYTKRGPGMAVVRFLP